jgi:RNA polymerase sigma factor (sigma-70 family)
MGDDAVLETAFNPALSLANATPLLPVRRGRIAPAADGPALVAEHLCTIEEAVRTTARRYRLTGDEAGELLSRVVIRLLEREAAALRGFRGESTLLTFLTSVARRLLLDRWIAERGRWRPSIDAQRLGRVAICLERLIYRDGLPLSQTAETIRRRLGVSYTDDELAFMLLVLPARPSRSFVSIDAVDLPSGGPDPLERLLRRRSSSRRARLARALNALDSEDRLLVKLRFHEGRSVAQIAILHGFDQRRLYTRFARIMKRLRVHMSVSVR